MKTTFTKPLKVVEVVVENSPSEFHISYGIWGKPSLAVCDSLESAEILAHAVNHHNSLVYALELFLLPSTEKKLRESGFTSECNTAKDVFTEVSHE